jgi:hypothetical protein
MREQLETQLATAGGLATGNPFSFLLATSEYQCIAASADRILDTNLLLRFTKSVRTWGQRTLGTSHASTPRLTIYIQGCWRNVIPDEVGAKWHYMLCLTPGRKGRIGRVKICRVTAEEGYNARHVWSEQLGFNELLLHLASQPYGIADLKVSRNPLEGLIFLDGYLW